MWGYIGRIAASNYVRIGKNPALLSPPMDIWTALRIVGRRWYVAVAAGVLCIVVGSSLVATANAVYSSTASIVLLPPNLSQPPERDVETVVNPFLQSGLPLTAAAVANAANSDRTGRLLEEAGLVPVDFEVLNSESAPIIFIEVESNDAERTAAAVGVVIESVESIVRDQQIEADSPANQLVTSQLLAPPPDPPVESLSARSRVAMAVVIASALVILTSALVFDSAAAAWRRREEQRIGTDLDGELATGTDETAVAERGTDDQADVVESVDEPDDVESDVDGPATDAADEPMRSDDAADESEKRHSRPHEVRAGARSRR